MMKDIISKSKMYKFLNSYCSECLPKIKYVEGSQFEAPNGCIYAKFEDIGCVNKRGEQAYSTLCILDPKRQ